MSSRPTTRSEVSPPMWSFPRRRRPKYYKAFTGKSQPVANLQDFKYRAFLQAAMIGWIDASAGMGFIKALLTSSMKPTATITGILKALLKEGLKQYYNREIKGTPELSITAGTAILYENRTYFDMIGQGMDLP